MGIKGNYFLEFSNTILRPLGDANLNKGIEGNTYNK